MRLTSIDFVCPMSRGICYNIASVFLASAAYSSVVERSERKVTIGQPHHGLPLRHGGVAIPSVFLKEMAQNDHPCTKLLALLCQRRLRSRLRNMTPRTLSDRGINWQWYHCNSVRGVGLSTFARSSLFWMTCSFQSGKK